MVLCTVSKSYVIGTDPSRTGPVAKRRRLMSHYLDATTSKSLRHHSSEPPHKPDNPLLGYSTPLGLRDSTFVTLVCAAHEAQTQLPTSIYSNPSERPFKDAWRTAASQGPRKCNKEAILYNRPTPSGTLIVASPRYRPCLSFKDTSDFDFGDGFSPLLLLLGHYSPSPDTTRPQTATLPKFNRSTPVLASPKFVS